MSSSSLHTISPSHASASDPCTFDRTEGMRRDELVDEECCRCQVTTEQQPDGDGGVVGALLSDTSSSDDGDGQRVGSGLQRGRYHLGEGVYCLSEAIKFVKVRQPERPRVVMYNAAATTLVGEDRREQHGLLSPTTARSTLPLNRFTEQDRRSAIHHHHSPIPQIYPAPAPNYEPFRRNRMPTHHVRQRNSHWAAAQQHIPPHLMDRANVPRWAPDGRGWGSLAADGNGRGERRWHRGSGERGRSRQADDDGGYGVQMGIMGRVPWS